ncbi:MAG: hypothetical protein K0U55_12835, partial [Gammaproteobacteria bacterium]|nr:hypothetical protein [Gammaproteobacteria bacterium]
LLSGGPYCTDNGLTNTVHAEPGNTISITCVVDNDDALTNLLQWAIPSFGVSVPNLNGNNGTDADQPAFFSTVNSANNTDAITNATLSFPAVSELDGAVVNCADLLSVTTKSCTLYILSKLYHY